MRLRSQLKTTQWVPGKKKQEKGNNICKERQLVRYRMEVRYWKDPQKREQSACPLLNQVFKSTHCVLAITLEQNIIPPSLGELTCWRTDRTHALCVFLEVKGAPF